MLMLREFQRIDLEERRNWPSRLTESLTGKKLIEDENLTKIQDQLGNQLGGVFGKGGLGDGLGIVLSKGLWTINNLRWPASGLVNFPMISGRHSTISSE